MISCMFQLFLTVNTKQISLHFQIEGMAFLLVVLMQVNEKSCDHGFVLEGNDCICKQQLSSDGHKCVESCSDVSENEVLGKCVAITKKEGGNIGISCQDDNDCVGTGGSYCFQGSCACDSSGGFITTGTQCHNCWSNQQYVKNNQCIPCQSGEQFSVTLHTCQCVDPGYGVYGPIGPKSCVFCNGLSLIEVSNWCQSCPVGQKFSNGNCICDLSAGYAGPLSTCENCWSQNKIADSNGYTCIDCPLNSLFQTNQCICDNSKGVVGSDPNACVSCWIQNQIVVSGQCQSCAVGAVFDTDKCLCDELSGYVGVDPNTCTDCWSSSQIVSQSQCVTCSSLDAYQVYDTDNICKCEFGYEKQNNICEKKQITQTIIVIAICVPIAVVIISVVLMCCCIIAGKKKKQKEEDENEVTQNKNRQIQVVPITPPQVNDVVQ
ncbi:Growth_factor receptor cysteine-rich domain superfamily [Hexamita inflata]|uniref:Growth factor receptor cysteine-rich domain superfamily n=1 Tax=Hexamita inflata TaxID=28002 RepID=A0AA86R426_9EUKA|nr:Growth factor receptor cysteine-rich domain superfamily [Hexamita inflata]